MVDLWSRRDALRHKLRRLHDLGIRNLAVGLWYRRKYSAAGLLSIKPGWPMPSIENRGGRIEIGTCQLFPGVRIECWKDATIRIGKGTYLNRNTEIVAAKQVIIGRDCKIARDVLIMDTDQHPIGTLDLIGRPVTLGDRVWLGSRVIVLKGVTIGDDSIVGAGTIVSKDIPAGSVVVGPPARVIRSVRNHPSHPPGT